MSHIYRSLFILFVVMSFPVWAQTPQFFSSLPDVPIMQGLEEIEAETLSFDKPEGRIIQTKALTDLQPEKIIHFYKQTLPQFGWTAVSETDFFRKDEYLVFDFSETQEEGIVKITIKPSL
ncbi:MAG: hypothetical protein GC137_02995 [Alphaproteobacteria bacterium]|nr:hypothetical protein [Alphaproteobacteria bacterium]